ncbi:hypothetical protein GCM10010500_64460 [Streptomyces nigrescens]|nr:hypothetical protein GCM10010500_64460 [Streptomyces libani subsp. libani]
MWSVVVSQSTSTEPRRRAAGGRTLARPVSVTIRCTSFVDGGLGPGHDARAGDAVREGAPVRSGGIRRGGWTAGPGAGAGPVSGVMGDVRKMCVECVSLANFRTADKGRRVKAIPN